MPATAKLYTAEEFSKLDLDGNHELDRGLLVKLMPPKRLHGWLTARLGAKLLTFVEAHGLGVVYGTDTGFILERNPDTVRGPDVAFVSWSHYEDASQVEDDGFWDEFGPDIAVEVLSAANRPGQMNRKVRQYLTAGSQLVWIVDGRKKQIVVHSADGSVRLLQCGDTLDGGTTLPGFQLPLDELFRPPRPPRVGS